MKETLREELIYRMFVSLYHEGYNASNLVNLLKEAGTSKGGMYHHFRSKKELALESMRFVGEGFIDLFWGKYFRKYKDPVNALEEIFSALPNATIIGDCKFEFKYGCPLNQMIQEMGALDEDFKMLLDVIMERWITLISHHLELGVNDGYLNNNFDPYRMARFIISSVEGTLTLMKLKQNIKTYEENMEQLVQLLCTFHTGKASN